MGFRKANGESTKTKGENMLDTIELLEVIGNDASLRHASAEELASRLAQLGASDALKAAASSGDSSHLSAELGHRPMQPPQVSQIPGEDEDEDEPQKDGDGEPQPAQASAYGAP